jgi:hypothetical protein
LVISRGALENPWGSKSIYLFFFGTTISLFLIGGIA